MKRILISGGTTFVSRFTARWFVQQGYEVYVLNRGSRPQEKGVHHICADRAHLGASTLRGLHFDAVLDITAYTADDVNHLLDALSSFDDYILISSSAVYPETNQQPFAETQPVGPNTVWGQYGTDKIEAEQALFARVPGAYVIRPPYLYGPMQNLYREPFVFDCALEHRPFYVPKDGKMKLQFFHVADLCRVMEMLIHQHPSPHILNVGNPETISILDFVTLCYHTAGAKPTFIHVVEDIPQRAYFCFHDYEYVLDTSLQQQLLPETIPLADGLAESFAWYQEHPDDVSRRGYMDYIDQHL